MIGFIADEEEVYRVFGGYFSPYSIKGRRLLTKIKFKFYTK